MLDMNAKFTHAFTRAVLDMLENHMISMLHNNLCFSLEHNLTWSCIQHVSDSRYRQREDE